MFLELSREELALLTSLVGDRLRELKPEMRRADVVRFQTELNHEQRALERVLRRLHECECDVTA